LRHTSIRFFLTLKYYNRLFPKSQYIILQKDWLKFAFFEIFLSYIKHWFTEKIITARFHGQMDHL
jgi:hypothetical protein